jgi:four helix bundle protein
VSDSIICARAFGYAVRLLELCRVLFKGDPIARHIASQLMRCSTAIGSNAEEAQEGQSKADYIAKMSISNKEARETSWWLRIAVATGTVASQKVEWELQEVNELRFMIRAAIRTARSNPDRGRT